MHSGKVVSYKAILDKVGRDWGFNYDIKDEEGLEWLAEFMAHTNVPVTMRETIAYIEICDGRGDLPYDLYKIGQTAHIEGVSSIEDAECGNGRMYPMRWKTDYFHKRYHLDNRDYTTEGRETYTVGQGYIFTSMDTGFVSMSYLAIPTDECGHVTIPDEQQWLEAGTHYVAFKIARKLWIQNQITKDKYDEIKTEQMWYFAQAVNHAKQWNGVDEAETVKNGVVRTIPALQDHASFFANMQLPEQRKFRPKAGTGLVATINTVPDSVQGPNPAV